MTAAGADDPRDVGPKRIWLVAVLFGLVSSIVLGGIVVLATRPSGSGSEERPAGTAPPDPTPTSTGTGDGLPSAALIGDSITEQSADVLVERLADRWDLVVDGRSGFTIAEQLPAAREASDADPTQVVINLGANDVASVESVDEARAELGEMVGYFTGARCIHLVTVSEAIEWNEVSYADGAEIVNQAIADLAAADPRVRVVDWSEALADAEAEGLPDGPVVWDTVHPTDAGQRLLAELYDEALSGCAA